MIKVEVSVEERQISIILDDGKLQELFENNNIRPSKAKIKTLKEMLVSSEDVEELLEDSFMGAIEEIITDEWES